MIKLIKSTFYKEQETKSALADFIKRAEILSMGEECGRFERSFAAKQGRKYATFVNSGSSANLLLIQALINFGLLRGGDKVGVSALTWATNVMPLIQLGLMPVAIDCELATLNISPDILGRHDGIKALFLTNVLGFCDEIAVIRDMCREQGVILLEDNCESLGSRAYGELLGNFGLASTFSFFVGHHISTIEGGMICTDDEELRDMLVMCRAHGWSRNLAEKKQEQLRTKYKVDAFYDKYTFYDLAFNMRPTEINGFLGNTQLPYWDEIVGRREKNFGYFHEAAKTNSDVEPLNLDHMDTVSNFALPLVFKDKSTAESYKKKFIAREAEIRPIIAGDITQQPFYGKYVKGAEKCHNARRIHDAGFYSGNNPEMTEEEIRTIVGLIKI